MKIKTVIWIMFLINILCVGLISYAFHNPWFLLMLPVNLPLLIRGKSFLYFEIALVILLLAAASAYAVVIFFKVENKEQLFWQIGSLSLYLGYLVYALLVLCSKNFKESLIHTIEIIEDGIGWFCPKCKAKVHFSIVCWSCGAPKPAVNPEMVSGRSEVANPEQTSKLDSYLGKQKEETDDKNG